MYLYQEADSLFHKLHPLTKLLLLILLICISFSISSLSLMMLLVAAYIALLLISHGASNLKTFWKMLAIFWIFAFVIWIVIPALRHAPWSYETAALLAFRVDSFVLSGLLFVTITRIEEFTLALMRLGIPYKGAFALSLGFRLVPLFYQNLQTIIAAQKSRGVDLDSGGPLQKAQKYLPMMGILISYGIRNADMMAMSLEAKGFGYPGGRTSYLQPHFGLRDILVLFLATSIIIILLMGL